MLNLEQVGVLRTEAEYEAALAAVEPFFETEPAPGTDAANRFDGLVLLIEDYEARHYPIPQSSPLEVLKFMMEQNDRTQADLGHLLGSRSRASEILNGRRELTLDQIRLLAREWRIPAAALVGVLETA